MSGVVLIGFMASGKSTVGRLLAETLAIPFYDTDTLFESTHASKPGDFIRKQGEAAFRVEEYGVLRHILGSSPSDAVISTGGGIVTYPDSQRLLIARSPVIWLRVHPRTVLSRTRTDLTDRPLLQQNDFAPLEHIHHLMEMRNPLYAECANASIDVDGREPAEIVEWIKTQLRSSLYPGG